VHGNFNVSDNYTGEYKLLIHCSNDELLRERPHRIGNIKLEQKRKKRGLFPLYVLSICTVIIAICLWVITSNYSIPSFMLAILSCVLSLMTTIQPNSFQLEEQRAILEINKILRQRRVEG
jgi:hypothetical protein